MILERLKRLREFLAMLPRRPKQLGLMMFDATALLAVLWLSYSIRLGVLFEPSAEQALLMCASPLIAMPVFIRLGLYRAVIRYLTERAAWSILKATSIASLLWVGLAFLTEMSGVSGVPRSVPLIYWALSTAVVAGSRFAGKWLLGVSRTERYSKKTLIYGAGDAAVQLSRALKSHPENLVVGFVDHDPRFHGMDLLGIRVYPPEQMESLIENMGVNEVIIAAPMLTTARKREIIRRLTVHTAHIRILSASATVSGVRHLEDLVRNVDINDLLGRSPVPPNPDLLREMIEGRAIAITGAGGSIGTELCRTVSKWRPSKLVLLEFSEHALYEIERELTKTAGFPVVPILGSATDTATVKGMLHDHQIQTVYHCAAYKHVPLVEMNAIEGVRNNILATATIAEAALDFGVQNFVLISSDKAVRPISIMGATKRWSELIVRYVGMKADAIGADQTFSSVRFGNVLGSNGSVVPLFREQIASGGPVTITHPDMTRYFMSIREAAELIIQAGALAKNGEILLLEMGDPIRIRDLAENMILLAGLRVRDEANPEGDIPIAIVGPREGEKMHEELFYDSAGVTPTSHPKILRAKSMAARQNMADALAELRNAAEKRDCEKVRRILFEVIEVSEQLSEPDASTNLTIPAVHDSLPG